MNKNLVEAAAVLVVLAFRTGEIAGLDVLVRSKRGYLFGDPEPGTGTRPVARGKA